jgi:hypothetical protein
MLVLAKEGFFMSYRKSDFFRPSELLASHTTVPGQTALYREACVLFVPLYDCFGGDVKHLNKVACNAKSFAKGAHIELRTLDKEAEKDFMVSCEGVRKHLSDIGGKAPKDRDPKRCQDLVDQLRFLQDRFLQGGSKPYP